MVSEGREGERDFCAVYRREFGIIEKKKKCGELRRMCMCVDVFMGKLAVMDCGEWERIKE